MKRKGTDFSGALSKAQKPWCQFKSIAASHAGQPLWLGWRKCNWDLEIPNRVSGSAAWEATWSLIRFLLLYCSTWGWRAKDPALEESQGLTEPHSPEEAQHPPCLGSRTAGKDALQHMEKADSLPSGYAVLVGGGCRKGLPSSPVGQEPDKHYLPSSQPR